MQICECLNYLLSRRYEEGKHAETFEEEWFVEE